jgi:ADP-heptose:LPS heptosyltransferase
MIRWKNILLEWILSFFISSKKKENLLDPTHPRILIVSTTALGDTLWATPAIKAIKKRFPQSYCALLSQKVGFEIFKNNPFLDDCFFFEEPLTYSFFSLLFKLRSKKFQALVVFHASQRLIFPLCALLGSEKRIAFRGKNKGLDAFFNHLISEKKIHEMEKRALLLETLDVPCEDLELLFFPTLEEEERIQQFLKEKKISQEKPLLILHPGATDAYRKWPEECYIELGNKLLQHLDCHLLISGGKKEQKLLQYIGSKIPGSFSLFPPLPLRDFAALLKKSQLLITNDTGPMHLSLAVKTKTLALFVPTQPKFTGPLQVPHGYALAKPTPCHPCLQRKCQNAHCWKQMKVDEVFEQAVALLSGEKK